MTVNYPNSFVARATRDPLIQAFYRDCLNLLRQYDTNTYMQQIEQIHKQVPIRHLMPNGQLAISGTRINETTIKIQINRSELVRLRLRCNLHAHSLNERIDSTQNYLLFKYQSQLAQEYRSREERMSAIDSVLIKPMHLWGRLRTICDHIDIVLKDLDQAAWAVTHIIEVMTAISKEKQL